MSQRLPSPPECAQCGADIPPGASVCPGCGADERTGWREQSIYDGLDLPDDPSGEDAVPPSTPRHVNGIPWYWWSVAVVLALLLGLWLIGLR